MMTSLDDIQHGYVMISDNSDLCFLDGFNWATIVQESNTNIKVGSNAESCGKADCKVARLCSTGSIDKPCVGGSIKLYILF